jgi:hypothetical protein
VTASARSRIDTDESQRRLAVLIDADNAPPAVIDGLLSEVARFGVASVKRIYGDWTSTRNTQWKQALLKHSLHPVQQFAYTSGKNATDSAMIIDAMDLMYTRRFDGFCLVSSDSDFTRLAQRLREEGLLVYGFGERKTPVPFVVACDKFVYTELLRPQAGEAGGEQAADSSAAGKPAATAAAGKRGNAAKAASTGKPAGAAAAKPVASAPAPAAAAAPTAVRAPAKGSALPTALVVQAIEDAADEEGWALLGAVGSYLTKIRPDFDPRLYGHKKLSDLLKAHPRHFEVRERVPESGIKVLSVRVRRPD